MLGRERREERREERRGGGATRYQMHQKLISIGDDYVISDEQGRAAFKLDGKALRLRKTIVFTDAAGRELCKIQERMLRVRDTMEIENPDGSRMATVKKAMITPLRERWVVEVNGGPDLDVQGNVLDHEYRIEQGGHQVAEVSRRWFRIRDSYGVEVSPGQNDILILAVTAVIDTMVQPGR